MRIFELLAGQTIMQKGDNPAWFSSREHMQMIGLDVQLTNMLRAEFQQPNIDVDCGVDGHTRHFRIGGVGQALHGAVCDRARDIISSTTPYRFEVQCVNEGVMTYEEAKRKRDELDAEVSRLGALLHAYPRGAMGLTPDEVKASAEYKATKLAYDRAFRSLQSFNAKFVKHFRKEYQAERNTRRMPGLAP